MDASMQCALMLKSHGTTMLIAWLLCLASPALTLQPQPAFVPQLLGTCDFAAGSNLQSNTACTLEVLSGTAVLQPGEIQASGTATNTSLIT